MRNPASTSARDTAAEVQRLRAQLERVQGRRMDAPVLPTHPAVAGLLPGRGLRPGAAYSIGASTSLLFALIAASSRAGSWCGVVGMPGFGVEAAERAGVDLSRLVLIPDPGDRWLAVTATIADVLPVVAVRPVARVRDADLSRLAARLRDRGAVLLVQGRWPQTEAMIDVSGSRWDGLGRGYGVLSEREVTVTVTSRRFPVPRRAEMLLPSPDGTATAPTSDAPLPFPAVAVAPDLTVLPGEPHVLPGERRALPMQAVS